MRGRYEERVGASTPKAHGRVLGSEYVKDEGAKVLQPSLNVAPWSSMKR